MHLGNVRTIPHEQFGYLLANFVFFFKVEKNRYSLACKRTNWTGLPSLHPAWPFSHMSTLETLDEIYSDMELVVGVSVNTLKTLDEIYSDMELVVGVSVNTLETLDEIYSDMELLVGVSVNTLETLHEIYSDMELVVGVSVITSILIPTLKNQRLSLIVSINRRLAICNHN